MLTPTGTACVEMTFDRILTTSDLEALQRATGATRAIVVPHRVAAAYARALEAGFTKSSRYEVGLLLSVLAAAVLPGGRVLEIGTGAGVGLAWIVHGLEGRTDVEVISVDSDPDLVKRVRSAGDWPDWISIVTEDGTRTLASAAGAFDLVFPDATGGKVRDIRAAATALRQGGILLIDDAAPETGDDPARRARLAEMRRLLLEDAELVCADLPELSSGVFLVTRRRT
jgi:predicted O-methyltransferase YrrM